MTRTRLSSTLQREGQKQQRASSSARSRSSVQPSPYEEMLALQGAVGNQAVGQLLAKKNLPQRENRSGFRGLSYELMASQREQIEQPQKAKQSIGELSDKYEQNGEKVAAEVVARNSSPVQRSPSHDAGCSETSGDRLAASGMRQTNNTGLANNLKAGIENLSGYSMDDVKVHYNSSKPAQLQALAYTQGSEIHIGPGQEKHLPHEAWHVVQQKQGRVKAIVKTRGIEANDDPRLEKEATEMGERATKERKENGGGSEKATAPVQGEKGQENGQASTHSRAEGLVAQMATEDKEKFLTEGARTENIGADIGKEIYYHPSGWEQEENIAKAKKLIKSRGTTRVRGNMKRYRRSQTERGSNYTINIIGHGIANDTSYIYGGLKSDKKMSMSELAVKTKLIVSREPGTLARINLWVCQAAAEVVRGTRTTSLMKNLKTQIGKEFGDNQLWGKVHDNAELVAARVNIIIHNEDTLATAPDQFTTIPLRGELI